MTTDAEATLFAAVHEYMQACLPCGLADWELGQAAAADRSKLLAAVDEYKVSSYPNVFEGHELVTKSWYALLRAKAAVCDAYMETRPDKDTSAEVWRAVNALRELESKP